MEKDKSKKFLALKIAIVAIVVLLAALYFIKMPVIFTQEDMDALKNSAVFSEKITVQNVEIGGLKYDEAYALLQKEEKKILQETSLSLTYQDQTFTLNADDLGASFDTQQVLEDALKAGREGNFFQRNGGESSTNYTITLSLNGEKAYYSAYHKCSGIARLPADATFSFQPTQENAICITEEVPGIEIDREALQSSIVKACEEQDLSPLTIPIIETAPQITQEMLNGQVVLRGGFTTSFAKSPYNDENRVFNIKKCAEIINSSEKNTVGPGNSFSLNDVLGDRTTESGWKDAPGYTRGRAIDQPGGGVCQVSTTMYCAVLCADLQVVDRTNHSIPVGYSEMGLDATISTGGPDFVFKNNTQENIYIQVLIHEDNSICINVFGTPHPEYDAIELVSEKTKTLEPEGDMVITEDPDRPAGSEEIYIKRRDGSIWKSYKVYKKDGAEIQRKEIFTSTYRAFAGEKIVGV